MFSNTDHTDVRIANIADNHHAEIRRITVIPTEITVSAYPSRRDDPNPNEPVRSRVTPHFALSGNPMKNPQTTGPGYIPSAQVMYPVRSHSGAPQDDPPIKSKDAGTTCQRSASRALHGELPLRPSLSPARTGRDKTQVSDKFHTML